MLFPEGGTSNGIGIIKFKRGAFESENPVKPVILQFDWNYLSPAFTIAPLSLMILHFSSFLNSMKVSLRDLPDFHPNEWMFTKHANCENHRDTLQRWEIYAWAVRDAMIRAGGFNQEKFLMRQKIIYDKYMMGNDPKDVLPPRMHVLNNWIM
jgi:hypothetical protein